MPIVRIATALCLAVTIAACAPAPTKTASERRIQESGYSFAVPDEPGWLLAGRTAERVVLGRRGRYTDETVIISAMLTHLPPLASADALAAYVKTAEAQDTSPERFKTLTHTVVPDPGHGTLCARSRIVAEDHHPRKVSSRPGYMILEIASLTCVHPDDPTVGVHITYSQRYYPGHEDPKLANKTKRLFGSLRFSPIEGK